MIKVPVALLIPGLVAIYVIATFAIAINTHFDLVSNPTPEAFSPVCLFSAAWRGTLTLP
jgi:hypothetical protein